MPKMPWGVIRSCTSLTIGLGCLLIACQGKGDLPGNALPKATIGGLSSQPALTSTNPAKKPEAGSALKVALVSPLPSAIFQPGDTILLKAHVELPAAGLKAAVQQVVFLANDKQVGALATEPFEFQWKDALLDPGTYQVEVQLTDAQGKILARSDKVPVIVGKASAPVLPAASAPPVLTLPAVTPTTAPAAPVVLDAPGPAVPLDVPQPANTPAPTPVNTDTRQFPELLPSSGPIGVLPGGFNDPTLLPALGEPNRFTPAGDPTLVPGCGLGSPCTIPAAGLCDPALALSPGLCAPGTGQPAPAP